MAQLKHDTAMFVKSVLENPENRFLGNSIPTASASAASTSFPSSRISESVAEMFPEFQNGFEDLDLDPILDNPNSVLSDL